MTKEDSCTPNDHSQSSDKSTKANEDGSMDIEDKDGIDNKQIDEGVAKPNQVIGEAACMANNNGVEVCLENSEASFDVNKGSLVNETKQDSSLSEVVISLPKADPKSKEGIKITDKRNMYEKEHNVAEDLTDMGHNDDSNPPTEDALTNKHENVHDGSSPDLSDDEAIVSFSSFSSLDSSRFKICETIVNDSDAHLKKVMRDLNLSKNMVLLKKKLFTSTNFTNQDKGEEEASSVEKDCKNDVYKDKDENGPSHEDPKVVETSDSAEIHQLDSKVVMRNNRCAGIQEGEFLKIQPNNQEGSQKSMHVMKRILRQQSRTEAYESSSLYKRGRSLKRQLSKHDRDVQKSFEELDLRGQNDKSENSKTIIESSQRKKKKSYPFANSQNLSIQKKKKTVRAITIKKDKSSKRYKPSKSTEHFNSFLAFDDPTLRINDHLVKKSGDESIIASDITNTAEIPKRPREIYEISNLTMTNSSIAQVCDKEIDVLAIANRLRELSRSDKKLCRFMKKICMYIQSGDDYDLYFVLKCLDIYKTTSMNENVFSYFCKNHWMINASETCYINSLAKTVERSLIAVMKTNTGQFTDIETKKWRRYASQFCRDEMYNRIMMKIKCSRENSASRFVKRMNDEIWYYIPFENGVYNFLEHRFVAPSKHFYNSTVLKHKLRLGFTYEPLEKFLRDLFIDEAEREYSLYILSTLFTEIEPNDHLTFFLGNGANGKSMLIWLLLKCLGPFGTAASSSLFCRLFASEEKATPALLSYKNQRAAFVVEPDQRKLKSEIVKKLCGGGETYRARNVYSSELQSFEMRTKFVICCNQMPEFDACENSHSIQRRLRVILFRTNFVQDVKYNHQRELDRGLRLKMKLNARDWIDGFYNKMFAIARKYAQKPPQLPKRASFECEEMNIIPSHFSDDVLSLFLDQRTGIHEKRTVVSVMQPSVLYAAFLKFLSENNRSDDNLPPEYPYKQFYSVCESLMWEKYRLPMTVHTFKTFFKDAGYKSEKIRGYKNVYLK